MQFQTHAVCVTGRLLTNLHLNAHCVPSQRGFKVSWLNRCTLGTPALLAQERHSNAGVPVDDPVHKMHAFDPIRTARYLRII